MHVLRLKFSKKLLMTSNKRFKPFLSHIKFLEFNFYYRESLPQRPGLIIYFEKDSCR
jgi:hypothetical protein